MSNKRILILANSDKGLYNFRYELIQELTHPGSYLTDRIASPADVFIAAPKGDKISALEEMGCHFIDVSLERRGKNPFQDFKLRRQYVNIIKNVKPDVVFTYTVKPNIYGGMACRSLKIPCVMNITGLGTAVEKGGLMQKFILLLYKFALRGVNKVFFQNSANEQFFTNHKLAIGKHQLLPGSGVNLEKFSELDYPNEDTNEFAFIGRIMREKGIDNYLEAAKAIREKYPNAVFHICGSCEKEYNGKLQEYIDDESVVYHGMLADVRPIINKSSAVVLPTYHEGMSNVLLEAAASGRPVIASKVPGCIETFDEGISGFGTNVNDSENLVDTLEKFINLPYHAKREMGINARKKVEKEFDRKIVVKAYLEEIEKLN